MSGTHGACIRPFELGLQRAQIWASERSHPHQFDGTRENEVVLAVQNTGRPIPQGLLPTLFDPLVRAAGKDEGADSQIAGANLGLGLYVVREIANAHGGSVEVTSDDSATRFELRLPRICVRRSFDVR